MILRITGRVKPFVRVEPERVTLNGRAGESFSETVRIVPETDEPFDVTRVHALRGTDIDYRLETVEMDGKKAYVIEVRNKRQKAGRYYDKIFVKIDSEVVESIPIIVSGNVHPAKEKKQ